MDYDDKHFQKRKTDLENRLDKVYDKIEVTETALVEAKAKKRSVLAQKVCGDNIYKSLIFFDKMNDIMNEAECREFICQLTDKVEIFEEEQANGQWLMSITFKLPIIPHDMEISWTMVRKSRLSACCRENLDFKRVSGLFPRICT